MFYFIYGDGGPLFLKIDELEKEIQEKFPGISKKIFDFSIKEIGEFYEVISQNSIFSPKELIIVKRFEKLKRVDQEKFCKTMEELNLSSKEIFVIYEENFDEFGRRVDEVTADDKKKKDKLLKNIEKLGKVLCERTENQKKKTIYYIMDSLKISEKESEFLIEHIGEDIFKIKNEMDKIKVFLDGEDYSFEKIKKIISTSQEYQEKKMLEDMISKFTVKDLLLFLEQEKDSVKQTQNYLNLLYKYYEEILMLLKIKILSKENKVRISASYDDFKNSTYSQISKYFLNSFNGRPLAAYPIYLKIRISDKYDEKLLKEILVKLNEIEYGHKSGKDKIEITLPAFLLKIYAIRQEGNV